MGKIKVPSTMVKPKPIHRDKKMKKSKAAVRVPDISEALIKNKPYWVKFLLSLGYTRDQAEVFAEVYTVYMAELSKLVKKQATEMVHNMLGTGQYIALVLGWRGAGIDQDDFSKRMKTKKSPKKQKHQKSKKKGG